MNQERKQSWPDLAARPLGASVIYANDELFAERENLIKAEDPVFRPHTFGNKGQIMDGWETRRRREPGSDSAIVRLGCGGVVRRVVVDTSYFTGNYPPEVSVEACGTEGYPSPAELAAAQWTPWPAQCGAPAIPATSSRSPPPTASPTSGDDIPRRRGGPTAGLRRAGARPAAAPRHLRPSRAGERGDRPRPQQDVHSSPAKLLMPGLAQVMGDGWETSRRRDQDNDWVAWCGWPAPGPSRSSSSTPPISWATPPAGRPSATTAGTYRPGPRCSPTPGTGSASAGGPVAERAPRRRPGRGMARLPVFGPPTPAARTALADRFLRLLPEPQLAGLLRAAGRPADEATRRAGSRGGLEDAAVIGARTVQSRALLIHIAKDNFRMTRLTGSSRWLSPSATTSTARRRYAWSTSPATATGTRSRT